jgi:hypothetical protein
VMPVDPMPSISLEFIVPAGAAYDRHHWRTEAAVLWASVRFDAGGYSNVHHQGAPAPLRELAAALLQATDLANHDAASLVAEGVAG